MMVMKNVNWSSSPHQSGHMGTVKVDSCSHYSQFYYLQHYNRTAIMYKTNINPAERPQALLSPAPLAPLTPPETLTPPAGPEAKADVETEIPPVP